AAGRGGRRPAHPLPPLRLAAAARGRGPPRRCIVQAARARTVRTSATSPRGESSSCEGGGGSLNRPPSRRRRAGLPVSARSSGHRGPDKVGRQHRPTSTRPDGRLLEAELLIGLVAV